LFCYCLFLYVVLFFYVFFFFQAEDGIRDLIVTGVQTCALPISSAAPEVAAARGTVGLGRDELAGEPPAEERRGPFHRGRTARHEIGRASCRERVEVWGVGDSGKKKRGQRCSGSLTARGGRCRVR